MELQKKQKVEETQADEIQQLREQTEALQRRNADADEKYAQYTQFFKTGILSIGDDGNVEVVTDLQERQHIADAFA